MPRLVAQATNQPRKSSRNLSSSPMQTWMLPLRMKALRILRSKARLASPPRASKSLKPSSRRRWRSSWSRGKPSKHLIANPRQVRLTSCTSHSKMAHPARAKEWSTIRASLSSLEADSSRSSSSSHANNQSRLSSHSIAKDPICNRTRTKDSQISRTFRISGNS